LTLIDIALLVACSAFFLAFRVDREDFHFGEDLLLPGWMLALKKWMDATVFCLTVYSPAIFFLRLLRPERKFVDIAREPGTMALGIVTFANLCGLMLAAIAWLASDSPWWGTTMSAPRGLLGPAIAGAWVILASRRGWRDGSGWIELAGRLVGVIAILSLCIDLLLGPWFHTQGVGPPAPPTSLPMPTFDPVPPPPG
jgi:hypothetical protein